MSIVELGSVRVLHDLASPECRRTSEPVLDLELRVEVPISMPDDLVQRVQVLLTDRVHGIKLQHPGIQHCPEPAKCAGAFTEVSRSGANIDHERIAIPGATLPPTGRARPPLPPE